MFKKHHRKLITLRRDLGLFEATLAGVGIIVGAGIYVLIGTATGYAGNGVWLSFIFAAIAALLTGFSYAELSSIYTEDSGEYSYVEHLFNKKIAFVIGYLVFLAGIIGAAAVALGFAGYLASLLKLNMLIPLAVLAIIFFSIVNFIGIKQSMKLNIIFTSLSILGLLIIIFLSFTKFNSINYLEISNISGVFKAASLIFFAYIGFESVVKLAEETKNPRKTIPLALLLSLGISTIIYILVAFAAISVLPWQQLAVSEAPLADVAAAILGSDAGRLLSIIALVSTGNTVLMILVAMSRMLYSMGHSYKKLSFLSYINQVTKTPLYAIILTSILTIAFVMIGKIGIVAEITNFAVFGVFAVINIAVIKSRYIKHRREMFHEPLNIGKFPVLALLGIFSNIFMIFNLEKEVIFLGIILTVTGVVLYRLLKD